MYNCSGVVCLQTGAETHPQYINYYNNIFSKADQEKVINLAEWTSEKYDISNWQGRNNLYHDAGAKNFLINEGVSYDYDATLIHLNEISPTSKDPLFENAALSDVRLSEDSPARNIGVNGVDNGALPYGSGYIVDLSMQ